MLMIDAGSYTGKIIETYQQSGWIDDTWDIYAFEPIPELYETCKAEFKRMGLNVKTIKKAVWIKNGTVRFNTSERADASHIANEGLKVSSIDFSEFVSTLPQVDLCSMDIEGAEYEVLQKMMDDGTISKIKLLDIEFHDRLMSDVTPETTVEFIKKLNAAGVQVRLKDRLR